MNCTQTRLKIVDYLGNECSPSEKKLIQAHLSACEACRKELADISALQSRMSRYFQSRAAQFTPSDQTLSQLQARLALEGAPKPRASESSWLSDHATRSMKGFKQMLKQPVLIALILLALLAGTAFSVPSVRAQVQAAFSGWSGFSIPNSPDYMAIKTNWDFTPLNPTRMPKDLKLKASMTGGDTTTNQLGLCYQPDRPQPGDPFIYIQQTLVTGSPVLPAGDSLEVRQHPGSLETHLAGQIRWCENTVTYEAAQRLTWYENNVKIEITGTYSERELLMVANSLRPVDTSTDEKAPNPPTKP